MIENVLIYVADSLRLDYLPENIAERGVAFETIAQSIFSAPSFATLATGRYPSQHGVLDWHNRISDEVGTIFELDGVDAGFWQAGEIAGHEIFPILRQDSKKAMTELSEPFISLERNDDPHVPFGGTTVPSAETYYTTRRGDWDKIRDEYQRGVEISATKFSDRLDELEEQGILDETLVVFTSDHGELLGEGGEVGHSSPARPELARVPTVFIHEDLSAGDFRVDPDSDLIEHVDVVETVLSALGRSESLETNGTDLLSESRSRAWGYNHVDIQRKNRSMYAAESIWWPSGGYVFHRNPRRYRLAKATYGVTRSASRHSIRHRPVALFKSYLENNRRFGTPPVDSTEASELINEFKQGLSEVERKRVELDDEVENTLEEMGYL